MTLFTDGAISRKKFVVENAIVMVEPVTIIVETLAILIAQPLSDFLKTLRTVLHIGNVVIMLLFITPVTKVSIISYRKERLDYMILGCPRMQKVKKVMLLRAKVVQNDPNGLTFFEF